MGAAEQLLSICPELATEIARCTEQAYRRGYQQGALYGCGLDDEIQRWRFSVNHGGGSVEYDDAIAPPDTRGKGWGHTCSALERLAMEAHNASDLIDSLTCAAEKQQGAT